MSASVEGGPGYARFSGDTPIDNNFPGDTLEKQFQLMSMGADLSGAAVEQDGLLYLTAGPTTSQTELKLAVHRYFYPNESFHLQIDAGIASSSSMFGVVGLALFNPLATEDSFTRIGLAMHLSQSPAYSWVLSNVPADTGAPVDTQPFTFSADTLHTISLDYDAATQIMILSVPDAGYSRLVAMSTYVGGFQILLTSQTVSDGVQTGLSTAIFDNLRSTLTASPYLVSRTPLSLGGVVYDDALPNDPQGGNPVYYTTDVPTLGFSRVAENDTWQQLGGQVSINAALVSALDWHWTIYTVADCMSFTVQLPAGAVLERFVHNILNAVGPGKDYVWNDSAAISMGDCGQGPGTVIWAIEPSAASAGENVTIYGSNFGSSPGTLSLGSTLVTANAWSDNQISFAVPFEISGNKLSITVNTAMGGDAVDFTVLPSISNLYPLEATGGEILWLSGTGFGGGDDTAIVQVSDQFSDIFLRNGTAIACSIPKTVTPGSVTVMATINGIPSNLVQVSILPYVLSLWVSQVGYESVLTLTGSNFGLPNNEGSFEVLLDGQALTKKSWSTQSIQVLLPPALPNGEYSVVIVANDRVSNEKTFGFKRQYQDIGGGKIVDGKVIVRTVKEGIIAMPPGFDEAAFSEVAVHDPALLGVLHGLDTYYVRQLKGYAFQPEALRSKLRRTFFIYHHHTLADRDMVRQRLEKVRAVQTAFLDITVRLNWSQKTTFTDTDMGNNAAKFEALGIPLAHSLQLGGSARWIGVVDTGIVDPWVENDFINRYKSYGLNNDLNWGWHGSAVATNCCASANLLGGDGGGFYGAAPLARFASYAPTLGMDFASLMAATDFAISQGASIVNLSWSVLRPRVDNVGEPTRAQYDKLRTDWWDNANAWIAKNNLLVVVTAPNTSDCKAVNSGATWIDNVIPADYNDGESFLVVGGEAACDIQKPLAGSAYKHLINISAPTGTDGGLPTTDWKGKMLDFWNVYGVNANDESISRTAFGTSFAAPIVSGIANLVWTFSPNLTKTEVRSVLLASATTGNLPNTYDAKFYGAGYVNAYNALVAAEKLHTGTLYIGDFDNNNTNTITYGSFKQDKTYTKTIKIINKGDGVLYFNAEMGSGNPHFRWGDVVFSSAHYRVSGRQIVEGYLRPGETRNVAFEIDTTGLAKGSNSSVDVRFSVFSSHGDNYYSTEMSEWHTLTAVLSRCHTTMALEGTPSEAEIPDIQEFRDKVMIPRKYYGSEWVQQYDDHGPEMSFCQKVCKQNQAATRC